jgi:hypothetical protein
MSDVYRVTFGALIYSNSNQRPRLAKLARDFNIDGFTAWSGEGWTKQWGWENTTTLELAPTTNALDVKRFIIEVLKGYEQDAAYVTIDGANPQLFWVNGTVESIE